VLRAGVVAGIMYLAIVRVLPGHRLFTAALRITLGMPIYVVLMALIDADARAMLERPIHRLRRLRRAEREAS
jgi:hypothetical protein